MVSVPVQMHTAHSGHRNTRFTLLHAQCGSRIEEQAFCRTCGKVVDRGELAKGVEIEKESYVVLSDEDIQNIHKKSADSIRVTKFVDESRINPLYFCHSHYLTPRGKAGVEGFALLRQAMVEEKKAALAKIVIRDMEYLLAIMPHDGTMVAFTLHEPGEILSAGEIKEAEKVKAAKIDKQALRLARSLVRKNTGDIAPEDFLDEYSRVFLEIVRAKVTKEPIKIEMVPERKKVLSLLDALEKSVKSEERTTRRTTRAPRAEPKRRAV